MLVRDKPAGNTSLPGVLCDNHHNMRYEVMDAIQVCKRVRRDDYMICKMSLRLVQWLSVGMPGKGYSKY